MTTVLHCTLAKTLAVLSTTYCYMSLKLLITFSDIYYYYDDINKQYTVQIPKEYRNKAELCEVATQ